MEMFHDLTRLMMIRIHKLPATTYYLILKKINSESRLRVIEHQIIKHKKGFYPGNQTNHLLQMYYNLLLEC